MKWLLLAILCLLPWAGFALAQRMSGGRYLVSIAAAGAVGAGLGAFLASAAAAMATAVDPGVALMRGAGLGLLGGSAVGTVAALATLARRRR
jgi:hypothetical protein